MMGRSLQSGDHVSLFCLQAWLFAGNSVDNQLGDLWALDIAAEQWTKLSDNGDQVKAWHQSHIVTTEQVSLSSSLPSVGACQVKEALK